MVTTARESRDPPLARRGGSVRWSKRFGGVVLVLCVFAWAWQESGLSDADRLWTNRGRAADYILGQRVDESTLEDRRAQALRDVRTGLQERARTDLEREYKARGETPPGLMAMMRESETRAREMIDRLPEGELDRLVNEKLDAESTGPSRRGGYFPPETDPVAIFGNPDRLGDLHPAVRWIVDLGDRLGGSIGSATRWAFTAVAGEGYTGKLFETIAIALWGTVLAVVVALPASLLGSDRSMRILFSGTSRFHRSGRWVGRFLVRRSFDVARGFNEIVLAMIFVAVLGLGPLPGVVALLVHTYGVLGKVFSEAIDTIDDKPVEGVLSTGAGPTQVVSFAVLPQISPYVVSQTLLRFEANVRGATILGVVGAGGIGQLLMDKFGAFEFQEVATMMIIIIVVVTLIDLGCTRLMKRLTG